MSVPMANRNRGVRTSALVVTLFLALLGATSRLAAQEPEVAAPRAQLEQRLRQRLGLIVREQLGLDEAQARRLGDVSGKYEGERRTLARRERELRLQLRDELQGGDQANQDRVARALDRMLDVQRERLEIVRREQKDLSAFLTPVQRAKYLVLQDQVRRRLEEARRAREDGGGAAPRRPGALRPRPRLP
jgi:Spy/CpxP family protein refolding chaperone